jgi:hypothetical protein
LNNAGEELERQVVSAVQRRCRRLFHPARLLPGTMRRPALML